MASVRLDFYSAGMEDLAKLQIFEASSKDGPFTMIEEVDEIGSFPDYISHYTTTRASSASSWFAIRWVDAEGAQTELSVAVQGGTRSVVARVADRVLLRDATLKEIVVVQEAEAIISEYFKTDDPYDVTLAANYRVLSGLTLLTLARSLLSSVATSSQASSFTAGLVSMKTADSTSTAKNIDDLIKRAERMLGMSYSVVAQMTMPRIAGMSEIVYTDLTRLLVGVE